MLRPESPVDVKLSIRKHFNEWYKRTSVLNDDEGVNSLRNTELDGPLNTLAPEITTETLKKSIKNFPITEEFKQTVVQNSRCARTVLQGTTKSSLRASENLSESLDDDYVKKKPRVVFPKQEPEPNTSVNKQVISSRLQEKIAMGRPKEGLEKNESNEEVAMRRVTRKSTASAAIEPEKKVSRVTRQSLRLSRQIEASPNRTPTKIAEPRRVSVTTPSTPSTPKLKKTPHTPKLNVKVLTPSLPERSASLLTPVTPREKAMMALHISSIPESLPCREREYEAIYNFMSGKLKGVDGGFMYIYGIPGLGKTATIERVIKRLQMESSKKKINQFTYIEINGMHLTRPKDAYCQIWKKLQNQLVSANEAKRLLDCKFNSRSINKPTVLLIDEFDMLFNKSLNVVDDILDWIDQSRLILVAIANSKDLIEKIKKRRTNSRMFREGLCDVQFNTYTFRQLQAIITDRLKEDKVFTDEAIEFLARKSAISGDVRLALNLCRRILTEAGDDSGEAITVQNVMKLYNKIYSDPRIEFIKTLSKQEQILLRAIRDVIHTTGSLKCSLEENVYDQYKALCTLNGLSIQDEFSLFRMLRALEKYGFLTVSQQSPCSIHTMISFGSNLDVIQMAFPPPIHE